MTIPEYITYLKDQEGFRANKYWDKKQYSIGYGTNFNTVGYQPIDEKTAEYYLKERVYKDFDWVQDYSNKYNIGLTVSQMIPLVDLRYNAGSWVVNGGLDTALKSKDWKKAAEYFLQYNKSDGKTDSVLVSRRQDLVNLLFPEKNEKIFLIGGLAFLSILIYTFSEN